MSSHQSPRPRLSLESLETREMPAAAVTATLWKTDTESVLRIEGTESDDTILVRHVDNLIQVDGTAIVVDGVPQTWISDAGLTRVEVRALGGKDTVDLGNGHGGVNPLRVNSQVEGGGGDDTLIGGAAADTLIGGAGLDRLYDNGVLLLRPTLLVVIPGFQPYRQSGDNGFAWREYADRLANELTAAGTPTTTLLIDWNSWGSNAQPAQTVAEEIRAVLARQAETHDVLLFGHSRGGILANVVAGKLQGFTNLGVVHEILLDPTAANLAGDRYPSSIPAGVTGHVYDDGYAMLPVGLTDGLRVAGASYHYVHDEMQQTHKPKASQWMSGGDTLIGIQSTLGTSLVATGWSSLAFWWAAARGAVDGIAYHTEIEDFYLDGVYVDQDVAAFVAAKGGMLADNQFPSPLRVVTVQASFDQTHADRAVAALQNVRWFGDLTVTMTENYLSDWIGLFGKVFDEVHNATGWDPGDQVGKRLDELQVAVDGFLGNLRGVNNKLFREVELAMYRVLERGVADAEQLIRANGIATSGEVATHWARVLADQLAGLPTSPAGVAGWLKSRLNSPLPTIAGALATMTSDARTITSALWNGGGANQMPRADALNAVAGAIYGALPGGATSKLRGVVTGLSAVTSDVAEVAKAVWTLVSAVHSNRADRLNALADALYQRLGGDPTARLRGAAKGVAAVTTDMAEMAKALSSRSGAGAGATALADALYRGINWTKYRDVAKGLASVTTDVKELARALKNGAGAGLTSVADALYNGVNWTKYRDVAKGLAALTTNVVDVAKALASRSGAGAGVNAVADALRHGPGFSFKDVASGVWNSGLSLNTWDLASALKSAGANAGGIVYAMVKGINCSLNAAASALRNGPRFSFNDVASGLWSSGLSMSASGLASAVKAAGAGFDSIVSAVRTATGLGYQNAWSIVRRL